jgi:aminoglycoside phosphotransferase (APT) family kinase protein
MNKVNKLITQKVNINESLVQKLISTQFPQWADLPITPVAESGWDNRTFHLGCEMSVRLPSGDEYERQVEKEQKWLPKIALHLPLPIPQPIAIGMPSDDYPWHWSVNRWLEGETASAERIGDLVQFAKDLGAFLVALQAIDTTGGPIAGPHSFYRGGDLSNYNAETRQSIKILKDRLDVNAITKIWEDALSTTWERPPVWVHGDVALGNLLVNNGRLCAVIDFGQLVIGDPACDLAIAWTLFKGQSREFFKQVLSLDEGTWARARGWTLWKALIIASGLIGGNSVEAKQSWRIIDELMAES